ncbi:MAG TPA: Xaa-Pro peptidase family protein [Negativicutes bacterium]
MKSPFDKRFANAQKMMAEKDIDILIVNNRENLIYFTGLIQIECLALIIPRIGTPCAITLWLDKDYVAEQTGIDTYGYLFPKGSLVEQIIERLRKYSFKKPRIGFERYFVGFSVYDALRKVFSEENFVNAGDLFYQLRSIKDEQEIAFMREAGKFVVAGMAAAARAVGTGVCELDVLAEAEYAMLKAGSGGSPFRPQVVSGMRSLLTHPCASRKKIDNGEIVVIHLGATCEGYCAKICRTVAVGDVGQGRRQVYEILRNAQDAAIATLKPGVAVNQVDAAAREIIREAGLEKYYLDVIGYGVGLRQSEFYPIIGKDRGDRIAAGMVVDLLLPTIYRPDIGGPRITDCVYVGERKTDFITNFSRQLILK